MPTFNVSGLGSGIDTQGLIQKLIELERRPVLKYQSDIQVLQRFQAAYSGLAVGLTDLRGAASGLDFEGLSAPIAQVGDTSALGVTLTKSAQNGTHDLVIQQLADVHRIAAQGFQDSNTTPIAGGAGTFTLRLGNSGAQISVAVTASTTLNELASAINAANGDVNATVINDGTRANASRLVLTGKKTGTSNAIQILSNPTLLDFSNKVIEASVADPANSVSYTGVATSSGAYTGISSKTFILEIMSGGAAGAATYKYSVDGGLTFDDNGGLGYSTSIAPSAIGGNTEGVDIAFSDSGTLTVGDRFYVDVTAPVIQTAKDAVFKLDGIVQNRASNTVADAIEGVTLDLKKADAALVNKFTISRSDDAVITKVKAFIDAYNRVQSKISEQQTWDKESKTGGLLLGDFTANALASRLRREISEPGAGLSGDLKALVDIGLKSTKTGKLELDETRLRSLLSTRRSDVLKVLASAAETDSSFLSVTERPPSVPAGSYAVNVTALATKGAVTAATSQVGPLGADETLSFTYSADANEASPTTQTFSVLLSSGSSQADVVDALNSAFATQGARLEASVVAGALTISAVDLGSDVLFTVASDTAAGPATTGIDTATSTGRGTDVQGTIGGFAAIGRGALLTVGEGVELAGLAATYTGSSLGDAGKVILSDGVGTRFESLVKKLNEGDLSLLGARGKSLQEQIKRIETSIRKKEDRVSVVEARLQAQFAAMERNLASMKSQGDYLLNQLSALSQR